MLGAETIFYAAMRVLRFAGTTVNDLECWCLYLVLEMMAGLYIICKRINT